jgi:AraC-like DNA-binding protein
LSGYRIETEPGDPPWFFGALDVWVSRALKVDEHAPPCHELHWQIEGGTQWQIKGKKYHLQAGHALLIPPHTSHLLNEFTKEQTHHITVGLCLEHLLPGIPEISPEDFPDTPKVFSVSRPLEDAVRQFLREATSNTPFQKAAMESAARTMTIELARSLITEVHLTRYGKIHHPAVAHARDLIDNHPELNWSLNSLAKSTRISARQLSNLFKKELQTTPHHYHVQKRIEKARQMLENSLVPITDIALDLGFSSSQNFSSVFLKQTGKSPSAYRKQKPATVRTSQKVR